MKPCPECGSKKYPESEWDRHDSYLKCVDCGYSTGWCYVPTASDVWDNGRTPKKISNDNEYNL